MSYTVELAPRARRDLKSLPREVAARVQAAIDALALDARPSGVQKPSGRSGWRIKVGDYRILYEIFDDRLVIVVIQVGHRREVYR